MRRGEEEHRLHVGVEMVVDFGHGLLVGEILLVAHPTDEVAGIHFAAEIDRQTGVSDDFYVSAAGIQLLYPLHALFHSERVFLVDIVSDGDDDLVEERKCLSHNVFMSFSERTEGSGVYGNLFHVQSRMMVKL